MRSRSTTAATIAILATLSSAFLGVSLARFGPVGPGGKTRTLDASGLAPAMSPAPSDESTTPSTRASSTFINWETPHVHPLDQTPDRRRLLAVNTAAARLEVFSAASGAPRHLISIPVGVDPVTVRARTSTEAWVVNHLSDSISIVDLTTGHVVRTLATADEPCDVVFAGTPARAFVSCSQANAVQVFNLANLSAAPTTIAIVGEEPKSLAVSPDGQTVYAAIFESGNRTTIIGGGGASDSGSMRLSYPPNAVSHPASPYAGVNPPPNSGTTFVPAQANANPPAVGLIVRKNANGQWLDDNNRNWTNLVSGPSAALSGRLPGWDLADHDIAAINASSLSVSYAKNLMNICMSLAINPANGRITVIGTEALNHVRFEPNLKGTFLRVNLASVNPANFNDATILDLNPHLTYTTSSIPFAERVKSIGDPRAIVWASNGSKAYVAGLGSNNVIAINPAGVRLTPAPIEVGEGPTGLVLDEPVARLYVLSRFDASIAVIDTTTNTELERVRFEDPTPAAIQIGRKHLYNTHINSGLGHIACASCHVDARFDRLAWDLGDPSGAVDDLGANNLGMGVPFLAPATAAPAFESFHPMKGPMTTQTLQDIIGHEPHHWRGDRAGIEAFANAFLGLQGDDTNLSNPDMVEFENFLATIHYPPNPFRTISNALPTNLPLPGHFTDGRFSAPGLPLANGNAINGLALYRNSTNRRLDNGAFACVTCHTLPTGSGPDYTLVGFAYQPIAPGPNGERHRGLVSVDGSTNISMKIPQTRNMHEKDGFNTTQLLNTAGFGYLHDGSVDSIERFVSEPVFTLQSNQEVSDLTALMLAFSGSDLPNGSTTTPFEPPGGLSLDTHAAVGQQTTLRSFATPDPNQLTLITTFITLANTNKVGLIVKGRLANENRGWTYIGSNTFQADRSGETVNASSLQARAAAGTELTYTIVPKGSELRLGIDADFDGVLNRDEFPHCPGDLDNDGNPFNGYTRDQAVDINDLLTFLVAFENGDPHVDLDDGSFSGLGDGGVDINDLLYFLIRFVGGC